MKPYSTLTIGEIKALTPKEIEHYEPEVGADYIRTHTEQLRIILGRKIIADHISGLRMIEADLERP